MYRKKFIYCNYKQILIGIIVSTLAKYSILPDTKDAEKRYYIS